MRYAIADTHFNDQKARALFRRRWTDEFVISQINATVGREDHLIVVGDFCIGDPTRYLQAINCKYKTLIRGNHDSTKFDHLWTRVADIRKIGNIVYCHYPMMFWHGSYKGALHCYGHLHDQREATISALLPGRRSMDVGCESLEHLFGVLRPISEIEIQRHIGTMCGHDQIGFYQKEEAKRKELGRRPELDELGYDIPRMRPMW